MTGGDVEADEALFECYLGPLDMYNIPLFIVDDLSSRVAAAMLLHSWTSIPLIIDE